MRSALQIGGFSLLLVLLTTSSGYTEQQVRVPTYNIFFLDKDIKDERVDNIRQTIAELDADVIGLQEVKDREALELIFDPNDWQLVIDDDSGDEQDVAVAVKSPLKVIGLNDDDTDLDADDDDFLFPGNLPGNPYPNRRDALAVQVRVPGGGTFHIVVHHWKSRRGGRAVTDPQREDAARLMVHAIENRFDDKNVFVVGDFNDNGDDRSLNILETGDPSALGGPEAIEGPLMLNLTESLLVQDIVSHGVDPSPLQDGRLITKVLGSRAKNNTMRGQNGHSGPILFDQILIPVHMREMLVEGSLKVFDGPVARKGHNPADTAASDHLPVYADFIFEDSDGPTDPITPPMPPPIASKLRITSLLPNPVGEDRGKEAIKLKNLSGDQIDLSGWILRDRAGNVLALKGSLAENEEKEMVDIDGSMPLNNNGDEVVVVDPSGLVIDRFNYPGSAAGAGQRVNR